MSDVDFEDPMLDLEVSLKEAGIGAAGEFDEAAYLRAFPDIAEAVKRGQWQSAFHHYVQYGSQESRLVDQRYVKALAGQLSEFDVEAAVFPPCGVDVAFVAPSGYCVVIGWIDDRAGALEAISLLAGREAHGVTKRPARCRRSDAEEAIGAPAGHLLGFWAVIALTAGEVAGDNVSVRLTAGGKWRSFPVVPRPMSDSQFRDVVFEYLASATYFGNPAIESFVQLDRGPGESLLRLNARMSGRIKAQAFAERYGPDRMRYEGSIVVCLYGKAEFFFLQSALFSAAQFAEDYEFIYVSNSPELTETLQKEAAIAERIYGLSQTLVILPDNAGFGAANNVAVEFARSDRILIVNPDVFPRDDQWAIRHTDIVRQLPPEQTRMFGAPLFYDDGSLMHSGMFFDIDNSLSIRPEGIVSQGLVRVEHYAKGAPPSTRYYHKSRPVPAVTGAFISVDRGWFESIGGFSEEYVFGHYEDADICLKSLSRGQAVWLHDMPMWHLEGKGSVRRKAHEGGSLVNRWHFTRTWGEFVRSAFATTSPQAARDRTVMRTEVLR